MFLYIQTAKTFLWNLQLYWEKKCTSNTGVMGSIIREHSYLVMNAYAKGKKIRNECRSNIFVNAIL